MLKQRTAVVTGASRGIGRAIAEELARQGADLALIYANDATAAEEVRADAAAQGVQARAYQCDVADYQATKAVAAAVVADFGRVDILVNNAGITRDKLLARMPEADFDAVIAVDLKGAYAMTHHLIGSLFRSPAGRIINIASVVGLMGQVGQANYAAAKAGLIGFTKAVAREVAFRKITCNAIAPGLIETDLTRAMADNARQALEAVVPLNRPGQAEEVAAAVAFLASDAAAYITGAVLPVDGGMSM